MPLFAECNCVIMCSLECLKVDLKGLKDDETSLVFDLDDTYFGALDEAEVKKGSLHVSVSIRKASGFFEFLIHAAGTSVALAIPIRHVHAPGKCNTAMTNVLEELSADRSSDEESDQAVDPRWEKLKSLKI